MHVRPWSFGTGERRQPLDDILALILKTVRIRFDLTAEQFANRVTELAAAATVPPATHAARLRLDDLYLATACAENEERAWEECEATHFAFVRSFARRFLPDLDARDLADQVIAALWHQRKIARYEGRSTLRTWLGTVVAHAAINAGKAAPRAIASGGLERDRLGRRYREPAVPPSTEDAAGERAFTGVVARAIAALGPEEKLLLQLYYEQGLTLDQMQLVLGSSKATLSRRLKEIRERLKALMNDMAEGEFGTSADALRERLSLDRIDFDLSALLAAEESVKGPDGNRV